MGNVPGTNSCPVADVVTLVPSQAAACDSNKGQFCRNQTNFKHLATDEKQWMALI